ncbi:MAG: peptidoglycan-binding protein [Thermoleophilaceae bacterium]|nr:peptidoglycan-binding protein [Thermoleophilaceae bacterium]
MHRTLRAGVAVVALALIPVAGAAAAPYASRTLSKGTSGSDVEALQRYLGQAGYETAPDGEFGPATARSVRSFETAEQRRPDGTATPSEQRLVRSRAEQAEPEPAAEDGEEAYVDDNGLAVAPASAPEAVTAIIEAGNEIATKPYRYGGGHGRWRDSGYDCSGSMSYALHGAGLLDTPLDSTGFMSWGERGRGEWVTTYANAGHSFMTVAGLRFDTSARKRSGTRWSEASQSARGYRVRHPEGL